MKNTLFTAWSKQIKLIALIKFWNIHFEKIQFWIQEKSISTNAVKKQNCSQLHQNNSFTPGLNPCLEKSILKQTNFEYRKMQKKKTQDIRLGLRGAANLAALTITVAWSRELLAFFHEILTFSWDFGIYAGYTFIFTASFTLGTNSSSQFFFWKIHFETIQFWIQENPMKKKNVF